MNNRYKITRSLYDASYSVMRSNQAVTIRPASEQKRRDDPESSHLIHLDLFPIDLCCTFYVLCVEVTMLWGDELAGATLGGLSVDVHTLTH